MALNSLAPGREKKRSHILKVASRVFAEHDYHSVSMDQVATTARVGKGTLYRYFDSKEDLYLTLLDSALLLLTDRLEQEEQAGLSPDQTLSRMVGAIVETFHQHLSSFRVLNRETGRLLVRKRQIFQERRRRMVASLRRALERGMALGVFRKMDADVVPSLVIGMVWAMVLNHSDHSTPDELARAIVDVFFHGTLLPSDGTG